MEEKEKPSSGELISKQQRKWPLPSYLLWLWFPVDVSCNGATED